MMNKECLQLLSTIATNLATKATQGHKNEENNLDSSMNLPAHIVGIIARIIANLASTGKEEQLT
jgi:hypothetical protein